MEEEIPVLYEDFAIAGVSSVNGQTGDVIITPENIGAATQEDINTASQSTLNSANNYTNQTATQIRSEIPTAVSQLNNDANYQDDTQVYESITTITDPIVSEVDSIENAINKTVVSDVTISGSASTDTLSLDSGKVNIKTGATSSATVPFPVASATTAGVMNAATFQGLQQTTDIANGLLNGAVAVSGLAAEPTQAQLTTAWETATGRTELMNRAVLYDITNEKLWTYYTNTSTWYSAAAGGGSVDVQPWTNTQAGIVKGSTDDGQIFAENDGTGSVNGWDEVKTDIENLEQAGFQTETDVNNKIAATTVSDLADGADYVKNTDFASSSKAGVITTSSAYATTGSSSNGNLRAVVKDFNTYSSGSENMFISKGTLENVITGKGLVSNTDYANATTGGVIKLSDQYAISIHPTNKSLFIVGKTYEQYLTLSPNAAIGKLTLDNVITGKNIISTITLTQAEYDALTTYDDNTNYQIIEA